MTSKTCVGVAGHSFPAPRTSGLLHAGRGHYLLSWPWGRGRSFGRGDRLALLHGCGSVPHARMFPPSSSQRQNSQDLLRLQALSFQLPEAEVGNVLVRELLERHQAHLGLEAPDVRTWARLGVGPASVQADRRDLQGGRHHPAVHAARVSAHRRRSLSAVGWRADRDGGRGTHDGGDASPVHACGRDGADAGGGESVRWPEAGAHRNRGSNRGCR